MTLKKCSIRLSLKIVFRLTIEKMSMTQKLAPYFLLLLLFLPVSSLLAQKGEIAHQWYESTPSTDRYRKVDFWMPAGFSHEDLRQAVTEQLPILEATRSTLKQRAFKESPVMYHFTYDQAVDDIPVYGASFKVNMTQTGRVLNFMTNLQSFSPLVLGEFGQSEQAVEELVETTFRKGQDEFSVHIWKNLYITDQGLLPVYKVFAGGNHVSGSWELVYDANTLVELERKDQIVYEHPPQKQAIVASGFGYVFNPDPLTSAGVTYGGTYVDNNDQDAQWLDDERMTVVLKDITENAGTYSLVGPWVKIEDIESPNTAPATTTDGNFLFQRSESGFEDVMCYYHTDSLQRYVQSLGFTNLGNHSFRMDPHGLNGGDNSHYVRQLPFVNSYCAFGEGGVDDAEDADVIVHEYGHFLSDAGAFDSNSGFERRGLDEGFGDYIAASWSHHINPYRCEDIFTWDGHNAFWNGRTAMKQGNYPPQTGGWNFYAYGEIWATVLMEAHNHPGVGKTVSDKNFFQELYSNVDNMTTPDAARLIIDADLANYGGIHEGIYRDIFCARNILTGQDCVVGRDALFANDLHVKVFPNPARDHFSVVLEGRNPDANYALEVVNLLGQTIAQQSLTAVSTRLEANELEAGVYWVRVSENAAWIATEKIVIQ